MLRGNFSGPAQASVSPDGDTNGPERAIRQAAQAVSRALETEKTSATRLHTLGATMQGDEREQFSDDFVIELDPGFSGI